MAKVIQHQSTNSPLKKGRQSILYQEDIVSEIDCE